METEQQRKKRRFNGELRLTRYTRERERGREGERERVRERERDTNNSIRKYTQSILCSIHCVCSMHTFIQVREGLTEVPTVLKCSLKSSYTNSQNIYSLRNIFPNGLPVSAPNRPSFAPVYVPVHVLGLTNRS